MGDDLRLVLDKVTAAIHYDPEDLASLREYFGAIVGLTAAARFGDEPLSESDRKRLQRDIAGYEGAIQSVVARYEIRLTSAAEKNLNDMLVLVVKVAAGALL